MDLKDSLQGNMREIHRHADAGENQHRPDSFSDQVMQKASRDMEKLGIEILSCNIQNVQDENGLIQDLGAENTSLIKRTLPLPSPSGPGRGHRPGKRRQGRQRRKVESQTQIAQKQNELEIKRAELKITADTKKAEAEAAY